MLVCRWTPECVWRRLGVGCLVCVRGWGLVSMALGSVSQGAARSLPWTFRAPSLGPFRHRDDLPTGAQAWPRAERARQSLLADEDDA